MIWLLMAFSVWSGFDGIDSVTCLAEDEESCRIMGLLEL
jgi:hypothetical protein